MLSFPYALAAATAVYLYLPKIEASVSCEVSISTLRFVTSCPKSEKEWNEMAQKKKCEILAKHQNCSSAETFSYHCILNDDASKLVEVCAPQWFITGYCTRFSLEEKRILNDPGLDCTAFANPCPLRYPSNEAYKYQDCYADVKGNENTTCYANTHGLPGISSPVLWTLIVISCALLIALIVITAMFYVERKKNNTKEPKPEEKMSNSHRPPFEEQKLLEDAIEKGHPNVTENKELKEEKEEAEKPNKNEENQVPCKDSANQTEDCTAALDVVDEKMSFRTLSGKFEGQCNLKNVTTIADLRDQISKELSQKRENVWVVQEENAKLFSDETKFVELMELYHRPIRVMVGNDRGVVCEEYGSKMAEPETCRMSCNHVMDLVSLFNYTKDMITSGNREVNCPECMALWEMEELTKKSNMSADEQLFYRKAMSIKSINKQGRSFSSS